MTGDRMKMLMLTLPFANPDTTVPAQVGRVYPNHPAALRPGMLMGSNSPEQLNLHTSRDQVERMQVRLAARAERPGGFGTCFPGTPDDQHAAHLDSGKQLSSSPHRLPLGHRFIGGASPCTLRAHYAHYANFSKLAKPPKIKL